MNVFILVIIGAVERCELSAGGGDGGSLRHKGTVKFTL